jgi:predicted PhzF superfamily epimerase YddE/YHI9
MKFFIVDAFTDEPFGGNAAGVVIASGTESFPSDDVMQKTAAELRYSETVFIERIGERVFRARYFTPTAEVGLCGHATIAAYHALAMTGTLRMGDYVNRTLSGDLGVKIVNDAIWMDMAAPERVGAIDGDEAVDELYSVMGLAHADAPSASHSGGDAQENPSMGLASADAPAAPCGGKGDAHGGNMPALIPEIVSTGLPDIMLPVASVEKLMAIKPDFPALARLSERYGVTGVHAFALPDPSVAPDVPRAADEPGGRPDGRRETATCHCRNFAPLYGIDEEAATGTANGALTYYLYERGLITPGETNVFIQGESMGRPSKVMTKLITNPAKSTKSAPAQGSKAPNAPTIKVGGQAITLAAGTIDL